MHTQYQIYKLGTYTLQSGQHISDAQLAYKTYGKLNKDKSNVIIYPTWFTGFYTDNEWLIGPGMALDPEKYFIIIVCAFGNGQSSSPSNSLPPNDKVRFPQVTVYDNVVAQYRLITEYFGVQKIKLVAGWSMGAQQAYQWGCLYPQMVERIAPICGSAKTAPHNFVFLEGVKAALTADNTWQHGEYTVNPIQGLKSVARVYAGWGFSQAFYRQELWKTMHYKSLEDFLVHFWEQFFIKRDANNLLTMLNTWQYADISNNAFFHNNLKLALSAITARAFVMPAQLDLYFPVEDNIWEVQQMPNADLRIIPGVWGHFAANGLNTTDTQWIDNQLKELLSDL